jgi:hypothetical protein
MASKTPLSPNLVALGVPRGQAKSEQQLPGAPEVPAPDRQDLPPPLPAHEAAIPHPAVEPESASPPTARATRQAERESMPEPRKEQSKVASSTAGRFTRKQAVEARSGITIRIRVSAADRLDNLARRTGISKQDLLDQAIQDMLDAADQEGNLTAPLR